MHEAARQMRIALSSSEDSSILWFTSPLNYCFNTSTRSYGNATERTGGNSFGRERAVGTATARLHHPDSTKLSSLIASMRRMVKKEEPKQAIQLFDRSFDWLRDVATQDPVLVADAYDFALQAYAAQGDVVKAENLVSRMWKEGIPVGRVARSSVVKAYCAANRRNDALRYLKSVSAQRADVISFNILLGACADAKDYEIGQKCWETLMSKMEKSKNPRFKPDAITCAYALRLHAFNSKALQDIWNEWTKHWDKFNEADRASIGASYVAALCESGSFTKALDMCKKLIQDIDQYLPIQLEITDEAPMEHHLQKRSKSSDKHASVIQNVRVACNTVLHAAVTRAEDPVMDELLHIMTSKGLTPDTVTYNALLRRSIRRQEGTTAVKEGIEEMQRIGLHPDTTSIQILIQCHVLEGQIEEAIRFAKFLMETYGSSPIDAWSSVIRACGTAGDIHGLARVYNEALRLVTHNKGSSELSTNMRLYLMQRGLEALYETLQKNFWRRVIHLDRNVDEDYDYSHSLGNDLFEEFSKDLDHYGEIQQGEDLITRMIVTLVALNRLEDALALIATNWSLGVSPTMTGQSFIEVLQSPYPARKQIQRERGHQSSPFNPSNLSLLLQAFSRAGRLDYCTSIIARMKILGIPLSKEDYISLIECCACTPEPLENLAQKVYRHAKNDGIVCGTRVHNALLMLKARTGSIFEVESEIENMKYLGISPNMFTYFVLREVAMLEKDKAAAEAALIAIRELISGRRKSPLRDSSNERRVDTEIEEDHSFLQMVSVPSKLLPPEEDSVAHWKGYYASDDEDW